MRKSKAMTGTELRIERQRLKMNQKQLADRLGYSRWKTVSEYENGHRPIPPLVAEMIRGMPTPA